MESKRIDGLEAELLEVSKLLNVAAVNLSILTEKHIIILEKIQQLISWRERDLQHLSDIEEDVARLQERDKFRTSFMLGTLKSLPYLIIILVILAIFGDEINAAKIFSPIHSAITSIFP